MDLYDSKKKGEVEGQQTFLKPFEQRGGKRTGAGRKSKRGPTYVARIPESYRGAVEHLITLLDDVEHDKLPEVKITIE